MPAVASAVRGVKGVGTDEENLALLSTSIVTLIENLFRDGRRVAILPMLRSNSKDASFTGQGDLFVPEVRLFHTGSRSEEPV